MYPFFIFPRHLKLRVPGTSSIHCWIKLPYAYITQ
nr:MAG TPA: hypothetical protein [Caudoviricetes sp.]